ncbi:MAG: NAD(P)-binding domain-containing protein, partial [Cyanobacteria bacterium J06648_11]
MTQADIGLIGLAVMGQNLVLNMADHGYKVAVYNRTTSVMKDFVADNPDTPGGLVPCESLPDFIDRFPRLNQQHDFAWGFQRSD